MTFEIKPLKWIPTNYGFEAVTSFGTYWAAEPTRNNKHWLLSYSSDDQSKPEAAYKTKQETYEQCKSAADLHWRRQLLDALTELPLKSQFWLARDVSDGQGCVFSEEPTFNGDSFSSRANIAGYLTPEAAIKPGHKLQLFAGEPVDCREKPADQLVACRRRGCFLVCVNSPGSFVFEVTIEVPVTDVLRTIPEGHLCNIVWGPAGISLADKPYPVPTQSLFQITERKGPV
jgi:hypothetical protein